jgi:iron(III) transport system substrate-binding protein
MSFFRALPLFVSLAAGLSAPLWVHAAPATVAELALDESADRQSRLETGAKQEGELLLYSSMPQNDINAVSAAFTKKYGIKVRVWRASSESVLQRVVTEAKGQRYEVDITENSLPSQEALRREGLLQRVKSPAQENVVPEARPEHGEWTSSTFDSFVQAYNTNLVRKEDLPKSYEDLRDPKWKGKLGIESADQSWFGTLLGILGEDKGKQLFRDVLANNGISVRSGHSLLTNLVASGEVPLALTNYNYAPAQLKQKGAPIEFFTLSPMIAQFRSVALLKRAPHPHAALLYYDFMLSDEAQEILARTFNNATSKKLDTPLKHQEVVFIDPGQALDKSAQWTQAYQNLFIKGR